MIAAVWTVLLVTGVATFAAVLTRERVPVWVSMVIALVLRVTFALMTSQRYTPRDVRVYFRATGDVLLHGHDPLQVLPGRQWNFLILMPAVHALELRSGLPWVYAVKIAPLACDVLLVWMVAQLAPSLPRTRALQYAVNPLSLLVVSLHGQVEPVALALALGGILLLRRDRPVTAGVLLGAAVAAKTWPVFILVAVLPLRDPRRLLRIAAGAAVVPLLCLAIAATVLDGSIGHDLSRMSSYSGYVDTWTWSGLLLQTGHPHVAGYGSPMGPVGSKLGLVGVAITLTLVRRRPPEARALCALAAVLVCTAGFGPQYLMWVLPLAIAVSSRRREWYAVAAAGWAGIFYLSAIPGPGVSAAYLRGLSWLPASLLVMLIAEQVVAAFAARPGSEVSPEEPVTAGADAA